MLTRLYAYDSRRFDKNPDVDCEGKAIESFKCGIEKEEVSKPIALQTPSGFDLVANSSI
jgi:hypothetical protein